MFLGCRVRLDQVRLLPKGPAQLDSIECTRHFESRQAGLELRELGDHAHQTSPKIVVIHGIAPSTNSTQIRIPLSQALGKLADAGIPLGNQSVLLAGINDSIDIQRQLVHKLVRNRVRPYYLYQCDLVAGAGHFRTTVARGIEIMEGLRGHTSGYAVPTYVVDAPGGGGKIPVMPQYLISQAPGKVVLRNYEGYISAYTEPLDYDPRANIQATPHDAEPGQAGVLGLLRGDDLAIKPQGFDALHQRGKDDAASSVGAGAIGSAS